MPKTDRLRLTRDAKTFGKKKGADLIGIAPLERFQDAPERYSPTYHLPSAACVISMGMRMNESVVRALRRKSSALSYLHFVNESSSARLDELSYNMARFLEDQGCQAYPIPALSPNDPIGLRGELSHKHVATAAGLGEIGWNGLFLSPRFGPRQTLTSVITDAPLEADPLYEGKLCEPETCGYRCARCPAGAIDRLKKVAFTMDGRRFEHCDFVKWRCVWGCGSMSAVMPMPKEAPNMEDLRIGKIREKLEKYKKRGIVDENILRGLHYTKISRGETPWCWLVCLASCPVGSKSDR